MNFVSSTALILSQYAFNLAYAKELIADLSEVEMTLTLSKGLVNHPAFTLGHLVTGSAMTVEDLGGELDLPDGWMDLFARRGPGDPTLPEADKTVYPAKAELVAELERQHNRVEEILKGKTEEELARPIQWRYSSFMPTLLDVVTFMCINHEALHLGSLAAWRRELGKESALARLS